MAYLSSHLSTSNPVYQSTLAQIGMAMRNLGTTASASRSAMRQLYETLIAQAGFLAYKDVFLYAAILAFLFLPLSLLFSPLRAAAKPGAA